MEFLFIAFIIFLFVLLKGSSMPDPFRYVWSMKILDQKYMDFNHSGSRSVDLFYKKAKQRISDGSTKTSWVQTGFLVEVEYIMRTRRSLDVLEKRAWVYAKELALIYGYTQDEVLNADFFCPGWNELWELYQKHKERIILKKTSHTESKHQSGGCSGSFHTNGDGRTNYYQNTSNQTKSKNQKIFSGISDLAALKKEYFRLAKFNHPDHGGSEAAMKVLNKYYEEALQKILATTEGMC